MPPKRKPHKKVTPRPVTSGENYARKPKSIGAVIENLCKLRGIDAKELASRAGQSRRNAYKTFLREVMNTDELMVYSEILEENLMELYHPNLKPKPSAEQLLAEERKKWDKEREALQNQIGIRDNRIRNLEGQLENAMRVIEMKNGR